MRSRNIKPGFYKNEDLAECSLGARLIFPGLWMMADRSGRLEYRPKRIKAELLPFDDIPVVPLIEELATWGLVKIYEVGGQKLLWIPGFCKHQHCHVNEKLSELPAHPDDASTEPVPDQHQSTPVQVSEQHQSDPSESLLLNPEISSLRSDARAHAWGKAETYLTRRKRKLTGKRLATFERFWEAFGYSKGKAEAADAWLDIPELTDALVARIVAAAEREAQRRPAMLEAGKTPKMAQGWISGRRWEDAEDEGAAQPSQAPTRSMTPAEAEAACAPKPPPVMRMARAGP